jgi:hypothetical protein
MRCICIYCGFLYNIKRPFDDDHVTSGICDECWPIVQNNLAIEIQKMRTGNKTSKPLSRE